MIPNDMLLFSQIRILPASIRETSSVVVGKKTRPTPQQYAESERPLNTQPLTQCLYQIPPLKTQRLLLKKRQEDFKSQTRGEKTPKETSSSKQGRVDTQMNLKRLWQHAQGLGPQAERRSGHVTPSLTQKLSPVDNHLYIQVISKGVSLWKQTTLQCKLHAWQWIKKLNQCIFGGSLSHCCTRAFFFFLNPFALFICLFIYCFTLQFLHTYHVFQFHVFMRFLNVQTRGGLRVHICFLCRFLGTFPFVLFCSIEIYLDSFDRIILYFIIIPQVSVYFLRRDRKWLRMGGEARKRREGQREGNNNQNILYRKILVFKEICIKERATYETLEISQQHWIKTEHRDSREALRELGPTFRKWPVRPQQR